MCSYCSTNCRFPFLPLLLRHLLLQLDQLLTLLGPFTSSRDRKSHTSLTLNQNLKMIKVSEEGISKAITGQKLGLICRVVSQLVNAKEKVFEGN